MISNLFNNLNAVDMWITGSIALSPVPCLFPCRIISSLTNYLMLIFIYNFHLSDIMASSGLLSKADKLRSRIITLESTKQKCLLAKTAAFFNHRALMVMNECIFMCAQTNIHTWMRTHAKVEYFRSVSFDPLVWNIIPVQGVSWKTTNSSLAFPQHYYRHHCLILESASNVSKRCQFHLRKHTIRVWFA